MRQASYSLHNSSPRDHLRKLSTDSQVAMETEPDALSETSSGERLPLATCPRCRTWLRPVKGEREWKPTRHLLTCPEGQLEIMVQEVEQ